jgi:hypothetical protein
LFKEKALKHFKEFTRSVNAFDVDRVKKNEMAWTPDQKFNKSLDKVAKEFFWVKHAYSRRQCFGLPSNIHENM